MEWEGGSVVCRFEKYGIKHAVTDTDFYEGLTFHDKGGVVLVLFGVTFLYA